MSIKPSAFLRTRVARRILGLFVLCALLPIGTLAVVSYREVANQLNDQSRTRVRQGSKATGMAILERLEFLDEALRLVGSRLDRLGIVDPGLGRTTASGDPRFGAVALDREGRLVPLSGSLSAVPTLGPDEREHLELGGSVLLIPSPSPDPVILMARAVDGRDLDRGILWASLESGYLWGLSALPSGTDICVLDHNQLPLVPPRVSRCPPAALARQQLAPQLAAATNGGAFEWADEYGDEFVAGHWPMFLRPSYLAPNWSVVLSESKASVLAPMANFRQTFPLAVLLALWVVLLLSNIQIRKSMDPLVKLQEGTRRIAQRDFDSRVTVSSRDEFEDLATSFNSMARQLGRQFSALTAINEIDRAVLSVLDTERIIETVLSRTSELLGCDGVSMSLAPTHSGKGPWTLVAVAGRDAGKIVREIRISGDEIRELRNRPDHLVTQPTDGVRSYIDLEAFASRDIRFFLVLPLFLKREVGGVIAIGYREPPSLTDDDLVQARQLADQVAVALSNTRLVEELDQLNWGALTALARTIDAKSPWTAGHSERVTNVSLAIGREMRLSGKQMDILHRGGLLHDIGKIGVPARVLDKPSALNDEERRIMQAHPETGARILSPIAAYADVIPIVLYHHERLDGGGYPHGLRGDAIPFLARLLAVADVFDALSCDRPYRPGWPSAKAVTFIEQQAGTHFDPDVTQAFLRVMAGSGELIAPPLLSSSGVTG